MSGQWIILRTSGGRTLGLTASLVAAGIPAWTPVGKSMRRVGRDRQRVERPAPIMPTFVFAPAGSLPDLLRCRAMPVNPHPAFSIFQHFGRIPLIADRDIAALRVEEDRIRVIDLKKQRRLIPVGSAVRMPDGAFAGLEGIVEQSDGKSALVAFSGRFRVQIASWLLAENDLEAGLSSKDMAAQAA